MRLRLLFAFLCVVWGATWIAMKLGSAVVPPALFAGMRWSVAGVIMLVVLRLRHGSRQRIPWHLAGRITLIGVLAVSVNQILMLYSLRLVGSGLAAVVNCALTPLSLLGFAIAMGQERLTLRTVVAMALGVAGIFVLFGPAAFSGRMGPSELLGAAGITAGTMIYAMASVMTRPLMRTVPATQMAGLINLSGGVVLLVVSLTVEPGAWAALDFRWGWTAWTAWLFLVGPAALLATTIFLVLVRDWGASRAGSYAFVSPIIAVLLGLWISGEPLHLLDAVGMALMLAGAWVALRRA